MANLAVEHSEINPVDARLQSASSELERKVRGGETLATEAVLATFPELNEDRDAVLELIYTEFVLRQELGAEASLDEWLGRFPQWERDLRELFQVHEVFSDDELPLSGSSSRGAGSNAWSDDRRSSSQSLGWIGNCELLEEIGRGGMGIVYRGRQVGLDRIVAVKTVFGYAGGRHRLADRFRTEAEAVARLQHPHIVQIHEVGEQDGVPYFVMEFVSAGSLADFVRERPLRPTTSAQLVECLARAIHYAHSQGIIHRDLKPENILLAPSPRLESIFLGAAHPHATPIGSTISGRYEPKISDFGLAKKTDSNDQQTMDGAAIGTPGYMAPEQTSADSSNMGPACDIYALGAVLYDMLVGRPPFHAATVLETINQVRSEDPTPPRSLQSEVPRDLETICLKCLQKQPERRYATADELADDLRRFLNGEPIRARAASVRERLHKWARRHPSLAALVVAVSIGVIGMTWQWARAEFNRGQAVQEAAAAHVARQAESDERERAARIQYAHDVELAQHEFQSNNSARALRLLESTRPDLRNWEWYFVRDQVQQQLRSFPSTSGQIRHLAWSPDGQLVAAVSGAWGINEPGRLNVWEVDSGKLRFSVGDHPSSILYVTFSNDGTRIATAGTRWHRASGFGGVRVWNVADGRQLLSLDVDAHAVKFSPDDQWLVVGRSRGAIVLHDSRDGRQEAILEGHSDFIADLCFRTDGKFLASAGREGALRVWDMQSRRPFAVLEGLFDVRHVAYSPDGRDLIAGTFGGTIKRYRQTEDGLREISAGSRSNGLVSLRISPDGQYCLAAVRNESVDLRDARTGRQLRNFPGHNGYSSSCDFRPDGRLIATGGHDGLVKVWDLSTPVQPQLFHLAPGPYIAAFAFHPDGSQLALAAGLNITKGSSPRDQTLRLWDVASQRVTKVMTGHTDWLTSVAFHPRGELIVTGSQDKTVRLWNPRSGEWVRTLESHTEAVTGVEFATGGSRIVSASRDGTVRIWDADSGSQRSCLDHDRRPVVALARRSDDLLASVTDDGRIWLWDAASGRPLGRVGGESGPVTSIAFSPNGKLLAAAHVGATIDLWDFEHVLGALTGPSAPTKTKSRSGRLELSGHTESVTGIAFSPDSARLVSTSDDRFVKLWDVVSGQEVLSLGDHSEGQTIVSFSPDGRLLVRGGPAALTIWQADRTGGHTVPVDRDHVSAERTEAERTEAERTEAERTEAERTEAERTEAERTEAERTEAERTEAERTEAEPAEQTAKRVRNWHFDEYLRAVSVRNWFAAAFHATHLFHLEPDHWPHVFRRGVMYAEMGNLRQALDDMEAAASLGDGGAHLLSNRAALSLFLDDQAGYAEMCRSLWTKYHDTDDAEVANAIAWTCCLGKDSGVDIERVVALANQVLVRKWSSDNLNTYGACLFRAGRYADAIAALKVSMRLHGQGGWPHDWAFLALSYIAIGDSQSARPYLDRAAQWLDEQQRRADAGDKVDAIYFWRTRMEMQSLLHEAAISLGDEPPTGS